MMVYSRSCLYGFPATNPLPFFAISSDIPSLFSRDVTTGLSKKTIQIINQDADRTLLHCYVFKSPKM